MTPPGPTEGIAMFSRISGTGQVRPDRGRMIKSTIAAPMSEIPLEISTRRPVIVVTMTQWVDQPAAFA